ncbi:MAG: Dabb family protein, partial [Acidimicrobiales bacterium]
MFRHIVLLTFDDATSPADVDAIVEGLETLPGSIPELRRYVIGRDARI